MRAIKNLRKKIENIADGYADLIDMRITTAKTTELCDATVMTEINEGIRMLNHVTVILERMNRLNSGSETNDSF